jgi:hypothetical protein
VTADTVALYALYLVAGWLMGFSHGYYRGWTSAQRNARDFPTPREEDHE